MLEELDKPVNRTKRILEIKVLEVLVPQEDGVELNEGYTFEIDGSLPQLADGIAKMMLELDKDSDLGEKAGGAFLTLVTQYYNNGLGEE